jgi:hypothetical protein
MVTSLKILELAFGKKQPNYGLLQADVFIKGYFTAAKIKCREKFIQPECRIYINF